MGVRSAFQYNPEIKVTAAQIGINKWEWEYIDSIDGEKAKSIMSEKKFDVLPIKDSNGDYKQYYSTRIWNDYDNLDLDDIDTDSTLYYSTSLRDLIKRFNADSRHFYFLSDYEKIVGLVSYANLSCQPVYNYLYFILSSIETGISNLLRQVVPEYDLVAEFKKKTDDHYQNSVKRFESDDGEYSFFDYIEFKDLCLVLKRFGQLLDENGSELLSYRTKFENTYNDLRKKVMHPVKTLLTTKESVNQIAEVLDDYEEIMKITKAAELAIRDTQQNISIATEERGEYG